MIAISEAADLAGRVQSLTQYLPLRKVLILLTQLYESFLNKKRNEVLRGLRSLREEGEDILN